MCFPVPAVSATLYISFSLPFFPLLPPNVGGSYKKYFIFPNFSYKKSRLTRAAYLIYVQFLQKAIFYNFLILLESYFLNVP